MVWEIRATRGFGPGYLMPRNVVRDMVRAREWNLESVRARPSFWGGVFHGTPPAELATATEAIITWWTRSSWGGKFSVTRYPWCPLEGLEEEKGSALQLPINHQQINSRNLYHFISKYFLLYHTCPKCIVLYINIVHREVLLMNLTTKHKFPCKRKTEKFDKIS